MCLYSFCADWACFAAGSTAMHHNTSLRPLNKDTLLIKEGKQRRRKKPGIRWDSNLPLLVHESWVFHNATATALSLSLSVSLRCWRRRVIVVFGFNDTRCLMWCCLSHRCSFSWRHIEDHLVRLFIRVVFLRNILDPSLACRAVRCCQARLIPFNISSPSFWMKYNHRPSLKSYNGAPAPCRWQHLSQI